MEPTCSDAIALGCDVGFTLAGDCPQAHTALRKRETKIGNHATDWTLLGGLSGLRSMKVPHFGLLIDLSRFAFGVSCKSTVEHPCNFELPHLRSPTRILCVGQGVQPEIGLVIILLGSNWMMNVLGGPQCRSGAQCECIGISGDKRPISLNAKCFDRHTVACDIKRQTPLIFN